MWQAIVPDIINIFIENRENILFKMFLGVAIFFAIYGISSFIIQKVKTKIEGNSLQSDEYTQKASNLVGNMIFIFLMIFNVLAVFQVIGFDTAIIMGGVSLSIGFAMETIIENMIAGILFVTMRKVKVGDFVEFLWSIKMKWTIEEINIRYSVIRSWDRRAVIIPNSILAKTPIKTQKIEPIMRWEIVLNVPRNVNVRQIQTILNQIINANRHVIQKEYTTTCLVWFNNMGIGLKTFFFANPQKKSAILVTRVLRGQIMEELKKYGIKKPYPRITLTAEG